MGGGGRLYNSVGLRFTPSVFNGSTFTSTGVDDFTQYTPFKQRICAMKYDSTLDKQTVLGYKDELEDSDWSTLISPADVNIMVEFPKFWYCRPSRNEYYIADQEIPGFLPSPMHDRESRVRDYAYVSRYVLSYSSNQSTYHSRSGKRGINQYQNESISASANGFNTVSSSVCTSQIHRNKMRPYKWYSLDYAAYTAIMILGMVKYGTTNFSDLVGGGQLNAVTASSGVKSSGIMDACPTLDGGNPGNYKTAVLSFGIENLWGHTWKNMEGILKTDAYLYINTDIENIENWPSSASEWTQVSSAMNSGSDSKYIYESVYPLDWPCALWGETINTDLTMSRYPYSSSHYNNDYTFSKIITGGASNNSAAGFGPFSFNAQYPFKRAFWGDGLLGLALSA